jgi:hypothetical protein
MRRSVDEQQVEISHAVRPDDIAPREAQELMSWPFFSLGETPCMRLMDVRGVDPTIPIEPTHEQGMATIWSAEVLISAASQMVYARNRGLRISRLKAATLHEVLAFIRTRGGRPMNDGPPGRRSSPISQSRQALIQRSRNNRFKSCPVQGERRVNALLTDEPSRRKRGLFAVATADRGRAGPARLHQNRAPPEPTSRPSDMPCDPLMKTFLRSKRSRP